jgi:hypothetical protein
MVVAFDLCQTWGIIIKLNGAVEALAFDDDFRLSVVYGATIMLDKELQKNQVSPGLQPGKPYPNTTQLAGFMKVNDTPAEAAG